MKCIQRFDTKCDVAITQLLNGCTGRCKSPRSSKNFVCVAPTDRVRIPRTLETKCIGVDELDLAGFAECHNAENRFRLDLNAQLGVIVEWPLDAAHVQINPHSIVLLLRALDNGSATMAGS